MLFIAEIGMNHNGHFGLAGELIKQAKLAGADIVKFQLGWRDGEGEINQITPEIISNLQRSADFYGIELLFSIITPRAWEMIKPFKFQRYKIASRTIKDYLPMVEEIVAQGKNTIISLGMWEGEGLPLKQADNIDYLWCRSSYPAEPWDLTEMPKDFTKTPYAGYSDHSMGIEAPLLAISRGAKIIEKHFTLDKSDTTIRDHALSATPAEFSEMTRLGRTMARYLEVGV
jgi:N,N'-diacetyllegionaminate synthase